MQDCLQCGEKFKYKQVLKTVLGPLGYKPVRCIQCGQNHVVTLGSKFRISFAVVAIPMISRLLFYRELSVVGLIFFLLMIAIPMLFILPYFIKYKDGEP